MADEERRLSIGILIHAFAPGGSERAAIRLGNVWARRGHEVSLLVGDPAGVLAPLVAQDVAVRSPERPIAKRKGTVGELGRWAGAEAGKLGFDVLFIPGNWHFRAIPWLRRAALRGTPIVAKISNLIQRSDGSALSRAIRLWSLRRRLTSADRVVAMSRALAVDAARVVRADRLNTIVSPVLSGPPAPIGRPGANLVAIGRLTKQKNLGLAIRAFAKVGRPDLRLVIAGDGEEREALEALAHDLGVADRTLFTGWVSSSDTVLVDARMLLLPSHYEGYPSVAIEALAAGVPVVATNSTPAMAEILERPEAGRMSEADPDAFAQAICEVLDAPLPNRAALASLVAHHQIDTVADDYLALFKSLVR